MQALHKLDREVIKAYKPVFEDPHSIISGNLSVSITRDPDVIEEAQALRYRIFFDEMGVKPPTSILKSGIDQDEFDFHCDHLIVYDHSQTFSAPKLIGTYRLLSYKDMLKAGQFYSQNEYDMSCLMKSPEGLLELGRSCVDPAYRSGNVIQLLWRGITSYLYRYEISVLFGCASFQGIDASQHQLGLSYLHHFHLSPRELCPIALDTIRADYDLLPAEMIDEKQAFMSLPPLIKGYLRVGCKIGDGAVLDYHCNTTDVCIILDMEWFKKKYSTKLLNA